MSTQVLIVEDEESLRVIYRHILSKIDCIIFEATNGQQALNYLDQITPSVILLDMMLPGTNGDVIIEYIQQTPRLQHTRVLIISSNKSYKRYEEMVQGVHFMLKPVRPVDIRHFVEEAYI